MKTYSTLDVYGIQREVPLNYTERTDVDSLFIESLAKQKHIIVYGSSKQGKTCLRKHGLNDHEYITVHCSSKMKIREINGQILKAAGFEIKASETRSISGTSKIIASLSTLIPFGGAKVESSIESNKKTETKIEQLELDVEDVNDIISALSVTNFEKFIVLEDFHYLQNEIQKDFSVQLKAFHEKSKLCFIIIGVWIEENRLIVFNGDLTGRVISINADRWSNESLAEVIDKGERLLNIQFGNEMQLELVRSCFGNVAILQEACYEVCKQNNIVKTSPALVAVNSANVNEIFTYLVKQQSGRYNSFLTHFSSGFQDTDLEMYKWLLLPILISSTEMLSGGLKFSFIKKVLKKYHPQKETLNTGNITQALQYTTNLQSKKDIKPIILDYDQTDLRLDVVDRSFIIWLEHSNRDELLDLVGLSDMQSMGLSSLVDSDNYLEKLSHNPS